MSPRNFCLAGKMGCAIPFDGESFAGGAGEHRLPARAEFGVAARIGSSEGAHRLPHLRTPCKFHDIRSSDSSLARLILAGRQHGRTHNARLAGFLQEHHNPLLRGPGRQLDLRRKCPAALHPADLAKAADHRYVP